MSVEGLYYMMNYNNAVAVMDDTAMNFFEWHLTDFDGLHLFLPLINFHQHCFDLMNFEFQTAKTNSMTTTTATTTTTTTTNSETANDTTIHMSLFQTQSFFASDY